MKQYIETIQSILTEGIEKPASRPGMPSTLQKFGGMMQIDLAAGFPLYTTKKTSLALTMHELNWFIKGHTSVKYLEYYNVRVWHDDSYNYYSRIADCVFKNATLNIIFDSTNTIISNFFTEALLLLFVHDETVDTTLNFRKYTKEEYKAKLKEWADTIRFNLSGRSSDSVLDGQIVNHPIIHPDPEYFKGLLNTVTYGEYDIYYDFGDCGAQYGYLWRNLHTVDRSGNKVVRVDQFKELIKGLKENPYGRRHIIDSWNPGTLNDMALNACHPIVQFDVSLRDNKQYLSCAFFMRSNDMFLGNPYNVSFYALLTNVIAGMMGFELGTLTYFCGDQHLYADHLQQSVELVKREPRPLPNFDYKQLAKYDIDDLTNTKSAMGYGRANKTEYIYVGLNEYMRKDILSLITGYDPMPVIKAPLSTGK